MPNTHTIISKAVVGSGGASSIIFSSIPATYTDLFIKCSLRSDYAAVRMNINLTLNAVSSGYTSRYLTGASGNPGTASNATGTSQMYGGEIPAATATANTFANADIYIPNYTSSSSKCLSIDCAMQHNATTDVFLTILAGVMSNTSTISTVTIYPGAGNFVQFSTAYLYGITNS
jgi:hypothetical protein